MSHIWMSKIQFYHLKIVVPATTNLLNVVPLTYVINMSLMEGIFSFELKLAKIMYNNVVNFMDKIIPSINISLCSGRLNPLSTLL